MTIDDDNLTKSRYYVLEEAVYWLETQQSQFEVKFKQQMARLPATNHFAQLPAAEIEQMATRNFIGICKRTGGAPMHGEVVKQAMHETFHQGIALNDWDEFFTATNEAVLAVIDQGLINRPRHQEIIRTKVQHICQMFRTTAILAYITCQATSEKG